MVRYFSLRARAPRYDETQHVARSGSGAIDLNPVLTLESGLLGDARIACGIPWRLYVFTIDWHQY